MARILIVGAGPTGLTLAAGLARFGILPRIIDKAVHPPDDRSRAIVLQARTLELFEDLGIVDEVLRAGLTADRLNFVLPSGRRGTVRFRPEWIDSAYGRLFTLPQDETERILVELGGRLGVRVERGVSLVGLEEGAAGVGATLAHADGSSERFDADWVLGCDGAHSTVRQLAGIPFLGSVYPNEGLLGDVDVEWDLPDGELSFCPRSDGILLAFPLRGPHRFRIIMILPTTLQGEDRHLGEAEFLAQLTRMTPSKRPPRILRSRWLTRYRLHHRGVPTYRKAHCFLAGDAAHIHSPVGAQGMNSGIQDAYNLAWKLALVVRGEAPPWVLDTYDEERQRVGQHLLTGTDRAFAVVAGGGAVARFVRRLAPALVITAIGSSLAGPRLARFISQTRVRYRSSRLSGEGRHSGRLKGRAPRAGDRIPDVELGQPPRRLHQLLRGTEHTLLLFAGASPSLAERLRSLCGEVEGRYPSLVRPLLVCRAAMSEALSPGALSPERGPVLDPNGAAHARFGAEDGAIYLIRPDFHIGFRGLATDSDGLWSALAARFSRAASVAA